MTIEWKIQYPKSYDVQNTMPIDRAIVEATRKTAELIQEQNTLLRELLIEIRNKKEKP